MTNERSSICVFAEQCLFLLVLDRIISSSIELRSCSTRSIGCPSILIAHLLYRLLLSLAHRCRISLDHRILHTLPVGDPIRLNFFSSIFTSCLPSRTTNRSLSTPISRPTHRWRRRRSRSQVTKPPTTFSTSLFHFTPLFSSLAPSATFS